MKKPASLIFSGALLLALAHIAIAQPQEPKEIAVDPKILDGYVGRYEMAPNFILNITRNDDHLYAQATGQGAFEIFAESQKEFFAKIAPIQITFTTDAGGRATELVIHQGGRNTTAKRIAGEPEKPKQHTAIALDPKILARYPGRYQIRDDMVMAVTLEDSHLFLQATGQPKFEIFPETDHDFFVKEFEAQITFHTDAQGQATELVLHQGGRNLTGKRMAAATAAGLQAQLAEIDKMAAADFARRSIGGVTVGVVSGKELVWTKCYGDADMEKKTPADRETVYRIGSVTKMFTAVMLEQLVEIGKVHYSDPAEKYFPEIKSVQGRFPDAPPVTLVQLATHTAGLAVEPDNTETYVTGGPVSAWEKILISALPHTRYAFEPGTRFSYSNIGFAILGAALSRAASEPYMEYIPKHVLEPLGMTHSALERNEKMLPHLSKGYLAGQREVDSETPQKEHEGRGYKMPNGALYTTVGDLARFASFLMGDGPESVLKTSSLERWLEVSAVPSNIRLSSGYGHGFEVQRRDNYVAFGHSGAVAGYGAALYINLKTDVGVIVLTNALGTPLNPEELALRSLDLLSK